MHSERPNRHRHGILRGTVFFCLLGLLLACLASTRASAEVAAAGQSELGEAAGWLRDYVRINTVNPPGNEHRAAAFLADLLHREGIATQLLVSPEGRTSLYARLRADPAAPGPAIVLMHHMDVVEPGPDWTVGPFSGDIRDERIWGRGAIDVKSLGIAQLHSLIQLKRSGRRLARDVIFLGVADEEAGGGQGAAWILERHAELFSGVEAVLNEGGSNRVQQGKVAWWGIEVTQKRPLWLRLKATGRGGHGSNLNLHSASHKLLRALQKIIDRPQSYRVTQPARDYFGALADLHQDKWQRIFKDLDSHVKPGEKPQGLLPGMPNWFADTIQVTVVDIGSKINVIPAEAEAELDIRLLPDTDEERFLADIKELVGDRIEVEVLVGSPPAAPSPTDHPVYRLLQEDLGREAPVVPAFIPGFTDSRYFRERGIPAYGFSPFALEGPDLRGIHAVDERIPIPVFEAGTQRLERLLTKYVIAVESDR